ncbi:FG-GAP-like repeat-containing protein [Streptomyces abikoensis]|uniref:FG-GAP-like repeat-containing protein n=1 Tax=Streptomyces abikoensis TaxID=97398 RepID=UPI0033FF045E
MVVHTSVAGSSTRINLVNAFSKDPVTIGHATIARRAKDGMATDSPVTLTFGGDRSTVVQPDGSVNSDAAAFPVKADEDLLVSIHLPIPVSTAPFHEYTLTTSYTSAPGDSTDHSAEAGGENFPKTYSYWAFLGGVDVTAANSAGTTVLLGDSQTDGGHTTQDANRRWSDDYARALQDRKGPTGVVNAGISGNALLKDHPLYGQSMVHRFDRDVLAQPGVRSVILYGGVNDIGVAGLPATEVIEGIRQLAGRAHAANLTFTVATIPPFKGWARYTPEKDKVRRQVNDYLRTTRDIDSYIDFDRSTRDPLNPDRLFAAYGKRDAEGKSDRLHFGDNGSQALSDAVLPPPVPSRVIKRFSDATAADFTGDGIPDVIATERTDRATDLYLWSGNKDFDDPSSGDGSFSEPKKITPDWNYTDAAAGDFNGDGKPDLIAKGSNNVLYIWDGKGDTDFSRRRTIGDGWTYVETVAGDFNSDGKADLVVKDSNNALKLLKNDGRGAFDRPVLLAPDWNYTNVTAGDFNGDGKPDLIAKDSNNVLYIWDGKGNADFSHRRTISDGWDVSQITAFSLRSNGRSHLLGRDAATGVQNEWLSTGNAEFTRPLRLADSW